MKPKSSNLLSWLNEEFGTWLSINKHAKKISHYQKVITCESLSQKHLIPKKANIAGTIHLSQFEKELKIVQKTEHKRFKIIPTVFLVKHLNRYGKANVTRVHVGKQVYPITSIIWMTNETNFTNIAQAVLLHELRETLYLQHGLDSKFDTHKQAETWWEHDFKLSVITS
jgi:hypothetical protein